MIDVMLRSTDGEMHEIRYIGHGILSIGDYKLPPELLRALGAVCRAHNWDGWIEGDGDGMDTHYVVCQDRNATYPSMEHQVVVAVGGPQDEHDTIFELKDLMDAVEILDGIAGR